MEKTFEYQKALPKIQIPELDKTCGNFLEWVKPLLTKEQFINTEKAVNKFIESEGDGVKLQKQLSIFKEKNNLTNWTVPFWEDIYLKPRVPLIIEGNVFYLLKRKEKLKLTQSELASQVILATLQFKFLIDQEELPVEKIKGKPLCMDQYKYFFSSTRIPQKQKDEMRTCSTQEHIVIFYKGNIYVVNIYDQSRKLKSYSQFANEIESVLEEDTMGQGIGILTSMERDKWAESRKRLLEVSQINKENLKTIETSLFALCLDEEQPECFESISRLMLYGNGQNRWFDKTIQFIITKNGWIGINMEHTNLDGSSMSNFIKYINNETGYKQKKQVNKTMVKPNKLIFTLSKEESITIKAANKNFQDVVSNNITRVVMFEGFGTNQIKKHKVSPDALVQIALQMAQYKLFGKFCSQYEAVMTRNFLHGRIEVMYTVTNESYDFIKSMVDNTCDENIKKDLFRKAAKKHIERIKECQDGKGVDTHLMALLEIYKDFGEKIGVTNIPDIFTEDGYNILTHSTLCTSTTSPDGLELGGWGPVVEDGFAIRYIKDKEQMRFHLMSRKNMGNQLEQLIDYFKESLLEIVKLLEEK